MTFTFFSLYNIYSMKIDREIFRNTILLIRELDSFTSNLNKLLDCDITKFYNTKDNLLYSIEKAEGYRWSDEVFDWIYDNKIKTIDLYNMITEYQEKAKNWEEEKWKYSPSSLSDME